MGAILLKNIGLDGKRSDIYIDNGKIGRIVTAGTAGIPGTDTETVDCTGKTAVPGFVNMHTHSAMSLMRGLGEDMYFRNWLDRIWEVESRIDSEYVYWATKVACIEMLKTGTTSFNDHYWFTEAGYRAAEEMGLRPVVSYVVIDRNDREEAEKEKERIMKTYEESLSWAPGSFAAGFHAIYSVSEEMIVWTAEFARRHGLRLHFHLAETEEEVRNCVAARGLTPVRYLDSLGVLGPDCIAAHTLWLDDRDIEILGARKVNCVHNINSNLKLASGYRFRYNELRQAGANICLGTDGCASSNNLDMLETMKTSAMVQKAWRNDPSAMPIGELLGAATANGAAALGFDTGCIREGAGADILIVDTDSSFFLSDAPFLANFIYSAHSDSISSVICKGRFVMKDRVVPDERQILSQARKVLEKIRK